MIYVVPRFFALLCFCGWFYCLIDPNILLKCCLSASKCQEAETCLNEKSVLDKLPSGMLYGAVGHEFKMNESALSMYILNKLSLHGNIHKAKLYIAWWMKALLWPETPKKLTLYFSRNNSSEFANLWFTVTFWSIITANNEKGLYLVYLQALLHPVSVTRDLLHNCCKKKKIFGNIFQDLNLFTGMTYKSHWQVRNTMACSGLDALLQKLT